MVLELLSARERGWRETGNNAGASAYFSKIEVGPQSSLLTSHFFAASNKCAAMVSKHAVCKRLLRRWHAPPRHKEHSIWEVSWLHVCRSLYKTRNRTRFAIIRPACLFGWLQTSSNMRLSKPDCIVVCIVSRLSFVSFPPRAVAAISPSFFSLRDMFLDPRLCRLLGLLVSFVD